jgi:hypothetical protein
MTRPRLIVLSVLGILMLYGVGTWVSNHTEWVEHTVPLPLRGEAARNPFYAAQRFADQLGATTTWDRIFVEPSADAVIVLSTWQWSLSASRRLAIERWVENGGRLVVDRGIWGGVEDFGRWSGIVWREFPESEDESGEDDEEAEETEEAEEGGSEEGGSEETPPAGEAGVEDGGDETDDENPAWMPKCVEVVEERGDVPAGTAGPAPMPRRTLCSVGEREMLRAKEPLQWALHSEKGGMHAVRVRVGRGSVTVINSMPFRSRSLFDGDHAWLLVNATQMKRGDEIHFLSEDEYPGLLALAWLRGRPVVLLSGLLIALLLWRGAVRFGPLAAAPAPARRSLAEQIRGTGQFVLRGGGAAALHAAMVRALEEAVRKRVKGFGGLSGRARTAALARVIGDRARAEALAASLEDTGEARGSDLHRTLAKIEAARRHVIGEDTRSSKRGRTT